MSWTLIEHQALTSSAASVVFNSIPQTYKTLKLVISSRTTFTGGSWDSMQIGLNGSTTATGRHIYGTGSATGSDTSSGNPVIAFTSDANNTASTFGNAEITFPNYASTTAAKPMSSDSVSENNATAAIQDLLAALWNNTSAVTTISIASSGGNFVSGSTFTLYGLA